MSNTVPALADETCFMIDAGTILVADDSSDDVELLRRALRKAGLKNPVQNVCGGKDAIDYLTSGMDSSSPETGCPLMMFLDLNMPRGTGFAVLDWLRQQPHLQDLPTIVFSNSELQSDIDRSYRLGAHGYWVKPSRFEDLVKMVLGLKEVLTNVRRRVESGSAEVLVPV